MGAHPDLGLRTKRRSRLAEQFSDRATGTPRVLPNRIAKRTNPDQALLPHIPQVIPDPVTTALTSEAVAAHQGAADRVHVDERIRQYITDLVRATRQATSFVLGASPRAGVALFLASRAEAHVSGRDYVIPDDVKRLAFPVLRHRVLLTADAEVEGRTSDAELSQLLQSLEAPR